MFERSIPFLRILCLLLAGLVLLQLARIAARKNPLAGVTAPAALTAATTPAAPPASAETNTAVHLPPSQPASALPPTMQACVDRIANSEIFGPVQRPTLTPAALLGIAGKDAFVRAPDGQTGLVREGGEFGGIKLLRIGTNRVLIEQNGRTQELTMFSGFGSEPLLPTEKEKQQ